MSYIKDEEIIMAYTLTGDLIIGEYDKDHNILTHCYMVNDYSEIQRFSEYDEIDVFMSSLYYRIPTNKYEFVLKEYRKQRTCDEK